MSHPENLGWLIFLVDIQRFNLYEVGDAIVGFDPQRSDLSEVGISPNYFPPVFDLHVVGVAIGIRGL